MIRRRIFLVAICLLFSACVNMNKNVKQDMNVLQAKVDNLEKSVVQLSRNDDELRTIIAGEQKRGEYLQQQVAQMANRLQGEIAGLQTRVGTPPARSAAKSAAAAVVDKSGNKVISGKMKSQPSVRDVQLALRNAGFYDGTIDDKPGPQTRQAIKAFQHSEGLRDDGVVGQQTWDKLRKYA